MSNTSYKQTRFQLPPRIRSDKKGRNELATRLALIDRIADLPGIETVECNDDTAPRRVDVFLRRERSGPILFCSLSRESVDTGGLDLWAKHQVVSRGWGRLTADMAQVSMPRNSRELDVVWKILKRSYTNLYVPSNEVAGSHFVSTWDSPKIVHETYQ